MCQSLRKLLAGAALAAAGGFASAQAPVVPLSNPDTAAPTETTLVAGEVVAPVAPAAMPATNPCTACAGGFDWKKVPRVRAFPKPGNFSVPPVGPGYYSALDELRGNCQKAPPKHPYPRFGLIQPSFFDVDNFSYLDDPKNTEHDIFDPLKRIRIGDHWQFTTGGDVRSRYQTEYNSRLTERQNEYHLSRLRVYGDLWYEDIFRLYVEGIGAWSAGENLPPLAIDENYADFQNLFVDAKLFTLGDAPVYARVGRQELLFGSQRLVSPLDWGNTRRTFQGARVFRTTEKFDFDMFWAQPVVPNRDRLDSVDNNQNFAGAWATYRPTKTSSVDAYYLMLDNTNRTTQQGVVRAPFTRHTIGGRATGQKDAFLYDFEGAMQLGTQAGKDVVAGMATAGVGYTLKDAPWTPTAWLYYDYASGGTGGNTVHTFNQLFPFGHYYMGWIDQVGRQNIHDINVHLFMYPRKWLTVWLQGHTFYLADKRDALYNAAGNAIRRDATGRAGSEVGQEVDAVLNFHLGKHTDVLVGYSHLWGGDFLQNTRGRNAAANAGQFFVQTSFRW
jgi:hypothetical protein